MPYLSCAPPHPNFIEVTNRLLMAMPIAPHMLFDITDVTAQVQRCCLMAIAASTVAYTLKLLPPAVGDMLVARATDTRPSASSRHSVNRPRTRGLETDQTAGRLGR
jgi:hypothetical protein